MPELIRLTDKGLYCEAGNFHIDPWKPVDCAVVTHAHSDHARWGMKHYLCAHDGVGLMKLRVGADSSITGVAYGETVTLNGVRVSLHPAGHILGSAQVRVEHRGEVWVVTGDYKTEPDSTCREFELLRCHTLITECTFGLPIYRWPGVESVRVDFHRWWRHNQSRGRASIVYGYSLGKAQRILSLAAEGPGPIVIHGALSSITAEYHRQGIALPETCTVSQMSTEDRSQWLVVAPPSAGGTPWLRRFGESAEAFASGWMAVRGQRRRRSLDYGFVLSDHVDWPSLLAVVKASGAERVYATHGYTETFARYLNENGTDARPLTTEFSGDDVEDLMTEAEI